jgi:hypothetical protein
VDGQRTGRDASGACSRRRWNDQRPARPAAFRARRPLARARTRLPDDRLAAAGRSRHAAAGRRGRSAYRRLRRRVFAGIFVGYAGYYLVRNNLALAIPTAAGTSRVLKAQLGSALTGLSIAYGLSKFLMGSVSDRSNPKYFLPLGLLLSSA